MPGGGIGFGAGVAHDVNTIVDTSRAIAAINCVMVLSFMSRTVWDILSANRQVTSDHVRNRLLLMAPESEAPIPYRVRLLTDALPWGK